MKYNIVERGDDFSHRVAEKLRLELEGLGFQNELETPEIIFSVGGDGTLLKAVHRYMSQIDHVVFVGIHTGKLGFYTDFFHDEFLQLIALIKENQYTDALFPLLEVEVCKDNHCETYYALNEMTLINPYRTQHLDVYINDALFESFQGTGLCVSTPSGSSAYNKSLGGALVHPKINAFQLTEIGSINNNVYRTIASPMIFPQGERLVFKPRDLNPVTLTIDHLHQDLPSYQSISCTLSERMVTIRQFRANDFWMRVKRSFL